jgi:proteasome lid subunit RPN8/RPN11
LDRLIIPLSVWQTMRDQVARWAPEEACGLLAGQTQGQVEKVFPVANRLHSPSRFEMDPHEQLRAFIDIETAGLELLAIYHSHPLGPAEPSPTDFAEFAYPGVVYLIWAPEQPYPLSAWNARGFLLDDREVNEIRLQVM